MFRNHHITPDSALGGWQMKRSLRWEQNDGAYLSRTGSSPTGGGKYSYSSWIKRVDLGGQTCLWGAGGGSQTNTHAEGIYITGSDQVALIYRGAVGSGSVGWYAYSTATLRDITSWVHVMLTYDNSQSGISNKIKYYFNGVESAYGGGVGSPGDLEYVNKSGVTQYIGRMDQGGGPGYARVYQAETHVADGYIWTPSDFGYTDAQTGQWRPKRPEDISVNYGNNGFYLDYADNTSTSTIGIDRSGNSNNWTANNFSVSAGSGNDSLIDTPTNNFPVINPLHGTTTNVYDARNGNLDFDLANSEFAICSVYLPTSGKWYAECVFTTIESGDVGVFNPDAIHRPDDELSFDGRWSGVRYGKANGTASIYTDNSAVQSGLTLISNNDIVGILVDRDAGTISFTINGTAKGTPVLISTIYHQNLPLAFRAARTSSGGSNVVGYFNFGQRPFSHLPTGYKSLSSRNRTTPSAAEVVRPQRHFGVLSWTGNDSSQTVTGLEFKPDFVWIKGRRSGEHHFFTDIIRGAGHRLQSSSQAVESDRSSEVTSFVRGGITVAGTHNEINGGGVNIIAMCWKGGGAAVANSDGSIASQVSANQEAGFSIVTWTGNATAGATVGHGLGKAPACIFLKGRNFEDHWAVYHKGIGTSLSDSNRKLLKLNDEVVYQTSTSYWNDTSPTASVFSLGTDQRTNKNTGTFVAYCWAEIPGYSSFGRYRGNGSSDGPYIHLGFKPAFIIYKKSDGGSDNWEMQNTTIDTDNPVNESMYPNTSGAQSTGRNVDFLANGFKIRNTNGGTNEGRSYTYIYMAWAERPSGTIFGLDANAR